MALTHSLARNETANAALGWGLLAVVLVTAVRSVLADGLLWSAFAAVAAAVLALPALGTRNWRVMVPWPLVAFVTAAVVGRALGVAPEVAGYVAVSGVALATVVELDAFTRVEMSRRFAVLFAALTTMAFQSWWTVGQYYSDRWLGTAFIESQTELQWDLVTVTAVSLVMGALFLWYFHRIEHVGSKRHPVVPDEAP